MLEDPRPLIAPAVVAPETPVPAPEIPGIDGTEQLTPEQAQSADQVFSDSTQHSPVATLFGVLTSALLLRDVAVDTFATSEEEEQEDEADAPDADPAE